MIRVLFVCLGNICRSPMAEAVFVHLVGAQGLTDHILADSAGTGHWHVGQPPHQGTLAVLARNNVACAHRARQLTRRDLDEFDYIVTMDEENLRDVLSLGAGRARVAGLLDFANGCGYTAVPDPYFDGRFDLVFELVREGAAGLLKTIRREHGL